jgi:hypothetical protein
MERFEVSPPELEGAASTLGSVQGSLGCPSRANAELGSAELQSAVAGAFEAADGVALAMAEALAGASRNAWATASRYAGTEAAATSSLEAYADTLGHPAAQTAAPASPGAP